VLPGVAAREALVVPPDRLVGWRDQDPREPGGNGGKVWRLSQRGTSGNTANNTTRE